MHKTIIKTNDKRKKKENYTISIWISLWVRKKNDFESEIEMIGFFETEKTHIDCVENVVQW